MGPFNLIGLDFYKWYPWRSDPNLSCVETSIFVSGTLGRVPPISHELQLGF